MNAWKETDKFSVEEKALLAITEEITLVHQQGLTDTTYANAKKTFFGRTNSPNYYDSSDYQCLELYCHQYTNSGFRISSFTEK